MLRRLLPVLSMLLVLLCALAATTQAQAPVRLNCGSAMVIGTFKPDNFYSSSSPASTTANIDISKATNPALQAVYQTQNTSATTLTYTLTNLGAGVAYIVRLHFAEIVYNASNQRTMNVSINTTSVLTNFDIYAAVGAKNRAFTQTFAANADASGHVTIVFTHVIGLCCVSGIEVLRPPILPGYHPLPSWAQGVTPTDSGAGGGAGPSAGDSVNLASGVYENHPGIDVAARNPIGPSPVFARVYNSGNAANGYSSPGLPLGWTHNYDVRVLANAGKKGPLLLTYPNGATEQWALGTRSSGSGSVNLTPPAGAPYLVSGIPDPSPSSLTGWLSLTITFQDESKWTFSPLAGTTFLLTRITNIAGRSILLYYGYSNILAYIADDAQLLNPLAPLRYLLYFTFGPVGSGNTTLLTSSTEYSDPANPRHIVYTYNSGSGPYTVSQLAPLNVSSPPIQWQYAINGIYGVAVPDPSGATSGLLNNAITYDSNGRVQKIIDANGNQHAYTYGAATQVQTSSQGVVAATGQQNFDSLNRDTGQIDAIGNQTSVFYEDPNNLYKPTRAINRSQQTVHSQYDSTFGNLLVQFKQGYSF